MAAWLLDALLRSNSKRYFGHLSYSLTPVPGNLGGACTAPWNEGRWIYHSEAKGVFASKVRRGVLLRWLETRQLFFS